MVLQQEKIDIECYISYCFYESVCYKQGCGSGYFSNASASDSTNKKRENDRLQFFKTFVSL